MISNIVNNSLQPNIEPTASHITPANHWDHILARIGWRRNSHRVTPGLYSLGNPTEDSPVFVTANYTLSFDALRSALKGINSYILVLDTKGINVWCAAGKGTFGTDELVNRIESTQLTKVVNHRILILPQLGAPGVAAHTVKKRSKFKVEYGPVRAEDLPGYLKTRKATQEMRTVRFGLRDRAVLIPVEFSIPIGVFCIVWIWLFILDINDLTDMGILAALFAGIVLFPILLPWIPTRDFSSKGFILGVFVAIPFILLTFFINPEPDWWQQYGRAISLLLILMPITAFLSLNFTGSSTFTSRSGVRREIFTYVPIMAGMFIAGIALSVVLALI